MPQESTVRESRFFVSELCCASEEQSIRKKLRSIPGISHLDFNPMTRHMVVRHETTERAILNALQEIGMKGIPVETSGIARPKRASRRHLLSLACSGIFLIVGQALTMTSASSNVRSVLLFGSMIFGGWFVLLKALKSVRSLTLDMNVLMTVALFGAIGLGQYGEGAAVVFLFALSLIIESMSVDRTRNAIHELMKLSPVTALIKNGNDTVVIPIEEVQVGQIVVVKPGDQIPLDGVVVSGFTRVDQSSLTGESTPKVKTTGDPVYAGTMNQRGAIELRVTKRSNDSAIARIIHLVEDAQSRRAPSQAFIERFAAYYTPGVFVAAVLVCFLPVVVFGQPFELWFYRSLVLLVIACPCALLISTPVTIVSALTRAARNGILIKGGIHLEELSRVRCVAFDKTGTLTHGRPTITDVRTFNSVSKDEVLRTAALLELKSEHPLAEALIEYAFNNGIVIDSVEVDEFESMPGKGIRGRIRGQFFFLGNHQLAKEHGICGPAIEQHLFDLERQGKTVMILANRDEVFGLIAIQDQVRVQSEKALKSLRAIGVEHVVLLSGDNKSISTIVGKNVGVDTVHSNLLPEDKLRLIAGLQEQFGSVAMVGEGVNDAPALAAANVGIAMGDAGSDTALETADVVLMSDDLEKLPFAMKIGKKSLSIIRQNVIFALIVKSLFIILGILGISSLWLAILADDGVTLLVAMNGMRLLRMK